METVLRGLSLGDPEDEQSITLLNFFADSGSGGEGVGTERQSGGLVSFSLLSRARGRWRSPLSAIGISLE